MKSWASICSLSSWEKEKYAIFNKIANSFGMYFESYGEGRFEKVNNDLVRYFRVEYGRDWEVALEQHLYKESKKNVKKAA